MKNGTLKIVHVLLGTADPELMGGINKVVHFLASEQVKLGNKVAVLGITKNNHEQRGNLLYELTLFFKKNNRFSLDRKIHKTIRKYSSDTIFHLHSSFRPEIYAVSRLLKKEGFRWVHTPHGGYTSVSLSKNYFLKSFYWFFFERKIASNAFAIQSLGEEIAFKNLKSKIAIIPNGYMLTESYKKKYSESNTLKISFCGRIEKYYKGLDILFDSILSLTKKESQIKLTMIGDGPDRAYFENFVKNNGLEEVVNFTGTKTGHEKYSLITQSDIFILSSRSEGLPTGVLEALNLALPVIISKQTNLGEYVISSNSGYVLDELTSNNLNRIIQLASSDKKKGFLREKGINGRKMISDFFSWEEIAKKMQLKLYQ